MKVTTSKTEIKLTFPCLMIETGENAGKDGIALMTSPGRGIVVRGNKDIKVGEYYSNWEMHSTLIPFDGKITLQND
jgi:hypothetical protein